MPPKHWWECGGEPSREAPRAISTRELDLLVLCRRYKRYTLAGLALPILLLLAPFTLAGFLTLKAVDLLRR